MTGRRRPSRGGQDERILRTQRPKVARAAWRGGDLMAPVEMELPILPADFCGLPHVQPQRTLKSPLARR
jgi:hypothetical protein